jgi:plastocyanin
MKKILVATAISGLTAAAAIPAFAATTSVKVGDNYFVRKGSRPTVTISKGSTLRFVWRGSAPHNVVKKSGPGAGFRSPVKVGGSYSHRFTRAGSYVLYCTIHGPVMSLNVRVR